MKQTDPSASHLLSLRFVLRPVLAVVAVRYNLFALCRQTRERQHQHRPSEGFATVVPHLVISPFEVVQ
jgi:hypothetical protein